MPHIPDPRRNASFAADDALGLLVQRSVTGDTAAAQALGRWACERLQGERDDEIAQALRQAPSPVAYRALWDAVCRAIETPDVAGGDGALTTRVFAFPILLVAAARQPSRMPGALPDIGEVRDLLERHGAAGATRNFGLSNALCSVDTLERLKPSLVYRWSREWSGPPRELAPADVHVSAGRERVHLRFLVGAGITPREAPSFLETASNIGAWGIPLTRTLVRQLAQPAIELLAIPRAPVSLLRAPHAGRWAELEAAFNLFASNTLRNFRSAVGDPVVIVSAHRGEQQGGEVRVSMSSVLDDTLLEGFRWPLHPLDDLESIAQVIAELMRDCRVQDVRFLDRVLPERLASGSLFLRGNDAIAPQAPH